MPLVDRRCVSLSPCVRVPNATPPLSQKEHKSPVQGHTRGYAHTRIYTHGHAHAHNAKIHKESETEKNGVTQENSRKTQRKEGEKTDRHTDAPQDYARPTKQNTARKFCVSHVSNRHTKSAASLATAAQDKQKERERDMQTDRTRLHEPRKSN
mmetsp:Transcript_32021/g.63467  ORF Transcript_32021/g.63467 Transcript_32021/m.63467 type:complete len:153 (+) Transcript_32021:327-785(+)